LYAYQVLELHSFFEPTYRQYSGSEYLYKHKKK